MLLGVAAVLAAVISLGCGRPSDVLVRKPRGPTSYIIGGEIAGVDQWPSQLSLEYFGSTGWAHQCGAFLFRNQFAITAAHCVEGTPIDRLRLWAGVIYRDNPTATNGYILPIASIMMHQNYSGAAPGVPNNLAIIRLTTAVNTTIQNNIKNAVLPPDDTRDFNHGGCFVSGYGRVDSNPEMSNTLQWRQIASITNQECAERFAGISHIEILPTHLCVLSDPPQDGPCNGDAGSPTHCHPTEEDTSQTWVVGLMSWNAALNGNCNLQYPTVSSRLSKYLQWLYANTNN